jgi:hypothetical protein
MGLLKKVFLVWFSWKLERTSLMEFRMHFENVKLPAGEANLEISWFEFLPKLFDNFESNLPKWYGPLYVSWPGPCENEWKIHLTKNTPCTGDPPGCLTVWLNSLTYVHF